MTTKQHDKQHDKQQQQQQQQGQQEQWRRQQQEQRRRQQEQRQRQQVRSQERLDINAIGKRTVQCSREGEVHTSEEAMLPGIVDGVEGRVAAGQQVLGSAGVAGAKPLGTHSVGVQQQGLMRAASLMHAAPTTNSSDGGSKKRGVPEGAILRVGSTAGPPFVEVNGLVAVTLRPIRACVLRSC